ncbi:hypothetical protein [Halobacteriovorax marinus]|uniref:hypothetical protein n=1 Tax=Halobacteriovorax marinus TaxID=97084 RepID=UPI003A93E1F5
MNQTLDTTLMIIIILLLILIIVLAVIAGLVLANYLKASKSDSNSTIQRNEKNKDKELSTLDSGTGVCKNHETRNSVGICSICEEEFCVDCLKQIDKVNLCPEHFNTFADNIWTSITNQRTTPDNPEDGVYIYNFKKFLWKEKGIPSYILNDYKIQVENDFIETYVQLHVREKDQEELSKKIERFKQEKEETKDEQ